MILVFLFMAQIIVCANLWTYALTNSNFIRLVVEKYQWAIMQCKIIKWKVDLSLEINLGMSFKCKLRISHHRMKQVVNKFRIKWCLASYFSLPAKLLLIQSGIQGPIRAPTGRFDNIGSMEGRYGWHRIWYKSRYGQCDIWYVSRYFYSCTRQSSNGRSNFP